MAKKKSISFQVENQKVKDLLNEYAKNEGFANAGQLSCKAFTDYLKRHKATKLLEKLKEVRKG
jgi:hypothetical protein